MLTVTRDAGLCVIHSNESATTIELTLGGLDKLLDPVTLSQLLAIRHELVAYYSVQQTCERASERSQEVAARCHRDPIADPEPAPMTERNDSEPERKK